MSKSKFAPPIHRARQGIPAEVLNRKGTKLYGYQVAQIKEALLFEGATEPELAKQYKVNQSMINHIKHSRGVWEDVVLF